MWVLLAQNGHFYNVNLAQNLKTVVTFYWNVRFSWYQHGWVCIYVLFPWIPIMGILVKPLVMALSLYTGIRRCSTPTSEPAWMGKLVGRFLIRTLHSSNFYMLPFWSPCHAISKTVFIFTLAQFLPVLVKLVKNSHFYNVNLAQNLKTVVTFYWNVRLSWYQHGWVCIYVLFPWIPITGILVQPLVMAIWAIYGQNGQNGHIWLIWPWLMA